MASGRLCFGCTNDKHIFEDEKDDPNFIARLLLGGKNRSRAPKGKKDPSWPEVEPFQIARRLGLKSKPLPTDSVKRFGEKYDSDSAMSSPTSSPPRRRRVQAKAIEITAQATRDREYVSYTYPIANAIVASPQSSSDSSTNEASSDKTKPAPAEGKADRKTR